MKTIKIKMTPSIQDVSASEGGVQTIVRKYYQHAEQWGLEFVDEDYDVEIVHAGVKAFDDPAGNNVAMLHGLNWTGDHAMTRWEHEINGQIAYNVKRAKIVTVPSKWVANALFRNTKIYPEIVPHGIDWEEWQGGQRGDFILWAKNRDDEICNPDPLNALSARMPDALFLSTFGERRENSKIVGPIPYETLKDVTKSAGVALVTAQETFCIWALEAMAAGIPVLGFRTGNLPEIVKHGVNGYLAEPGDIDDLEAGARYCLEHKDILGENAREMAHIYTWDRAMQEVRRICEQAIEPGEETVAVIIPCYNKEATIERAIASVLDQRRPPDEIIVVDDGSTDGSAAKIRPFCERGVHLIRQENRGVAHARNAGIRHAISRYICCLDGDDALHPEFLEKTLARLRVDRGRSLAYTRIYWVDGQGNGGLSDWPGPFDSKRHFEGGNQIPTACLYRRDLWERLGGYRQRYAPPPFNAGAEDAELWVRMVAYGAEPVFIEEPLFIYTLGQGQTAQPGYVPPDYLSWHPWLKSGDHPFTSYATPANGLSHLAYSYDNPLVSVIIPVARHHVGDLINALDSLEAQTFRRWEAIVIADFTTVAYDELEEYASLRKQFPYIKWLSTDEDGAGAGIARNIGVDNASADAIIFLDADDWFVPEALAKMYGRLQHEGGGAVYSDYHGISYIDPDDINKVTDKVRYFNKDTGKLVIDGIMAKYDCVRARKQPENPPYVWCPVTTMFPKYLHYEIGRFDETLESWEDYLYFIRMAIAGVCFHKVDEPLFIYSFDKGRRREEGRLNFKELDLFNQLQTKKLEGINDMGCKGCGKEDEELKKGPFIMGGNDLTRKVQVMYYPERRGRHALIGLASKENYGYQQHGRLVMMQVRDILAQPQDLRCPDGQKLIVDRVGGRVGCPSPESRFDSAFLESGAFKEGRTGWNKRIEPTSPPEPVHMSSHGVVGAIVPEESDIIARPHRVGHAIPGDSMVQAMDDLSVIKGITEDTRDKLHVGGIKTFLMLSRCPDNVLKMRGVPPSYIGRVKREAARLAGS